MEYQAVLPRTNENGYYEIRLESIGGLGANLCGKLLGELGAVYLNLNAASFSSYGSEKRGSPVKAFIRYSAPETEIGINSPVETPDILGLFHEAMIGKSAVTAGVTKETKIVVNTDASPEEIRERLCLHAGTVYCVDALKIAMEAKTRINMVMLGAIARVSDFIPREAAEEIAAKTIGKKYPAMREANLTGIRRGYEELRSRYFPPNEKYKPVAYQEIQNEWGYENEPAGGVNPCFGSTVSNDLSASREGYIPLFIKERCINCGLCDTACPDMVFQFGKGEYKGKEAMVNMGLDYHHCKGCLRCVEVCPTNALVKGVEREHPNPDYAMTNQELLPDSMAYEEVGANSYVTSESYLTEKRVDGGLM
ncbi:MAG: 2-oxoacid:acceptor oxidoreductase family protein [Bacteroidales bacterium]|nr:2-oxoacid:acceptor oxidoreductase family protein [Clostridium sp.]MCM1202869.1 2-oxoacid:acceptor oxidoreductase family protein [Bacteroidales bacterium]